jgi:hypothetical protein
MAYEHTRTYKHTYIHSYAPTPPLISRRSVVAEIQTKNSLPLLHYSCSPRVVALPTGQLNARRVGASCGRAAAGVLIDGHCGVPFKSTGMTASRLHGLVRVNATVHATACCFVRTPSPPPRPPTLYCCAALQDGEAPLHLLGEHAAHPRHPLRISHRLASAPGSAFAQVSHTASASTGTSPPQTPLSPTAAAPAAASLSHARPPQKDPFAWSYPARRSPSGCSTLKTRAPTTSSHFHPWSAAGGCGGGQRCARSLARPAPPASPRLRQPGSLGCMRVPRRPVRAGRSGRPGVPSKPFDATLEHAVCPMRHPSHAPTAVHPPTGPAAGPLQ